MAYGFVLDGLYGIVCDVSMVDPVWSGLPMLVARKNGMGNGFHVRKGVWALGGEYGFRPMQNA